MYMRCTAAYLRHFDKTYPVDDISYTLHDSETEEQCLQRLESEYLSLGLQQVAPWKAKAAIPGLYGNCKTADPEEKMRPIRACHSQGPADCMNTVGRAQLFALSHWSKTHRNFNCQSTMEIPSRLQEAMHSLLSPHPQSPHIKVLIRIGDIKKMYDKISHEITIDCTKETHLGLLADKVSRS